MKKQKFKEMIITKITSFHESKLRADADRNSNMEYLNVATLSLRGKPNPALRGPATTTEVKEMRPHIKMLCGDYFTYAVRASQSGGSSHCRLCGFSEENIDHVLNCSETSKAKLDTMKNLSDAVQLTKSHIDFALLSESNYFTQFILDCTSLNLPNQFRVNIYDTAISDIFKAARKTVNSIHSERIRKLKQLESSHKNHLITITYDLYSLIFIFIA